MLSARTFCSATPAPPRYDGRQRDLPGSWGTHRRHAPLFDPGGPSVTGQNATNGVAFRSENDVGSTISFISGLNHAACRLPVYASRSGSPLNLATLGSGGWLILAGSGLAPDRVPTGGFNPQFIATSDIPLLQALPGALSAETSSRCDSKTGIGVCESGRKQRSRCGRARSWTTEWPSRGCCGWNRRIVPDRVRGSQHEQESTTPTALHRGN